MATTFDSHFADAGFPALLTQFGESIVYWPRAGGSRSINAIVERNPPAIYDAAGNVVLPTFTVRVHNSCRSGVSSSEMDTGGDEIEIKKRIGDVIPTRFTIGQIISQSSGVLRFSVM